MNNIIRIAFSALITAVLAPWVKSYALSHHTQFNLTVVIFLFAAIFTAAVAVKEFRQLMAIGKDEDDE